jgi:hypothetical protein
MYQGKLSLVHQHDFDETVVLIKLVAEDPYQVMTQLNQLGLLVQGWLEDHPDRTRLPVIPEHR